MFKDTQVVSIFVQVNMDLKMDKKQIFRFLQKLYNLALQHFKHQKFIFIFIYNYFSYFNTYY